MAGAAHPGRVALGYYATPTPGDDQSATFAGEWFVYVTATIDGGRHWETVEASNGDPVQRGCLWRRGLTSDQRCRNLYDFQSMALDNQGRVLVGYADGCVSVACRADTGTPADSTADAAVIARQVSGPRLIAAFDPPADPTVPESPVTLLLPCVGLMGLGALAAARRRRAGPAVVLGR
jgi:hypothetical protein